MKNKTIVIDIHIDNASGEKYKVYLNFQDRKLGLQLISNSYGSHQRKIDIDISPRAMKLLGKELIKMSDYTTECFIKNP